MDTYKTDLLDLRRMDCMELLKATPDKAFELAIVDPPYGIGFDGENQTMTGFRKDGTIRIGKTWANPKLKGYVRKEWDKGRPPIEYFEELQRVSKNQIIWGGNYFADYLKPHGGWIFWEKGTPEGFSLSQGELAYNTCLNSIRVVKILWSGYKKQEHEDRIHPTQKPAMLYRWILSKFAKEGDRILDTHLGSMSIAIACHYAGYHLTGTELDADYFREGVERVKRETAQMTLL
jgi:site-specific DNA-methyltransferase (adenine-specific)